ncbi:class I SAM-dependent methyltransferase [Derxia lacustris]|uniref:class I SAM-dependent methyltransferase n=1 Tax=Derxia lacustris TaxID=764842 RepID=UPI000A176872|nr:class I SAM-dependent methyltransferase [Derxia lacustris]
MTGFSTDWLRLREPWDRAARAAAWPQLDLGVALAGRAAPLTVVDLGCGSGANLRELAPRLGGRQHWRLVDHDAALLAAVPDALARWAADAGHRLQVQADGVIELSGAGFSARIERQPLDLAQQLHRLALDGVQLVTGSALLDLVSADWLDRLAAQAAGAGAALLFALSVDGRCDWLPADPQDGAAQALFDRHQRRDKGFGPALGLAAVAHLAQRLAARGYRVAQAPSDWVIEGEAAADMLAALLDGMAAAAAEQAQDEGAAPDSLRDWQCRRHALLAASRLRIGHVDLLAWPASALT